MPRRKNFLMIKQKGFFNPQRQRMENQIVFYTNERKNRIMAVFNSGRLTEKDGLSQIKFKRK